MKLFYDHLVIREEVSKELRSYYLSVGEHIEIMRIADETIHLEVMDVILTSLPLEKHKEFLKKMHQSPHDKKLIDYLKIHDSEIEIKIKDRAGKVKAKIISEIRKAEKK